MYLFELQAKIELLERHYDELYDLLLGIDTDIYDIKDLYNKLLVQLKEDEKEQLKN